MVKLTGPLNSISASGTLAGVLTFNKQPRGTTLRRKPKPKHPRTTSQVAVQTALTFVTQQWKELSPAEQASWNHPDFVDAVSAYTTYVKFNCQRIRRMLAPLVEYPGDFYTPPCQGWVTDSEGRRLSAWLAWNCHTGFGWSWGVMLWRGKGFVPTPIHETLCHVGVMNDNATHTWIDQPLSPGTYYYRLRGFSQTGHITPSKFEIFVNVTE